MNSLSFFRCALLLYLNGCYLVTIAAQCESDIIPPSAICDAHLIASLPFSGEVTIDASSFDVGSLDNCSPASALIFSFTSMTTTTSRTFNCSNIGELNCIEMWVTDEAGNQSFCESTLEVRDLVGACGTVDIYASQYSAASSSESCVEVKVRDFTNMISLQWTITWDVSVATFNRLEAFALPDLDLSNFNTTAASMGQLLFSWFDPDLSGENVPDDHSIFRVCFDMTTPDGCTLTSFDFSRKPTDKEVTRMVGGDVEFVNGIFGGNSCPETLTLVEDDLPSGIYQTTQNITASNILGPQATIEFLAAENIDLLEGFEVPLGTEFLGRTGVFDEQEETIQIDVENRSLVFSKNDASIQYMASPDLYCSPNPFQHEFQIIGAVKKMSHYQLWNTNGQEVRQGILSGNSIAVPDLQTGIYWLEVSNGAGKVLLREWIVKR